MNADHQLQQAFRELKQQDAANLPAFARVARERRPIPASPWWPAILGATAAVAIFAVMLTMHRPSLVSTESQWAALSNWQPATDQFVGIATVSWSTSLTTPSDQLGITGKETYEN